MSKVLIIKNTPREGAGLLDRVIAVRRLKATIIDMTDTVKLPPLDEYAAVIVLGGPDSANDATLKMQREIAYIKDILDRNIPYLGICLGLQTLVKAAGGKVIKNPVAEVGFVAPDNSEYMVTLSTHGRIDPLFNGLGDSFRVFQLHGETVVPTPDMHTLATGKFCTQQVIRYHKAYGIQCHFELTQELFELWLHEDADLQKRDTNSLRYEFESIFDEYTNIGVTLFHNFFDVAGL